MDFHERCNFGLETTTTTTKGEESFQVIVFFLTLIIDRVQGRVSITYPLGIELYFFIFFKK
jgi:hypothetical protein